MGVFSEMDLERKADGNQTAQPVSKDDEILAKVQERDDARQQAEAEAAQAVLEQLAQAESKANAEKNLRRKSEAQKRKAHEEAEAKRKAEWEARKKAREEEELFAWESAVALEDDALVAASMKRLGDDAERLTRRNMKQCVTEYVQTLCLEDLDFAPPGDAPPQDHDPVFSVYQPKGPRLLSKQEMKDNDEKPVNGIYGCDVPDDLCYQWAKEYFWDMDAEEDKENEEKFVPKPYTGKAAPKSKKEGGEEKAGAKEIRR